MLPLRRRGPIIGGMPQRKSGPGAAPQPASPANDTALLGRPGLLALVLVAATFVAYMPAMRAGFIWDDQAHVTNNVNLRSAGGLWRIWFEPEASQQYYPLQLSSYWLEFHLWGLHPLGYHLVNVLLHAGNAILLWQVLRRLQVPGAWLAAAIFAVHPVEVESAVWISERKNVLSGMFYLLALLAFFRYRPPAAFAGKDRRSDCRSYLLGLFLFACALLSKTVACSLPAVMVLLIWWKKGRVEKRDVYALAPFFVVGAALGLTTAWLEKHHVGAAGTDWSLTFVQRCLLAGRALWFYAGKLFWPHPLSFIYPRWEIDAHQWWQYLFALSAAAVWITLWLQRRRIGKGPLVAVSAFAVMLFPALGFFDVYPFRFSFVADHFQYLAGAGLIALVVSLGTHACRRAGQLGRQLGVVVALIVLAAMVSLTWARAHAYRDAETLWRDTLAKNPRCWMAHDNLGNLLTRRGNLTDAVEQYELSIQIKPDYSNSHSGLGNALLKLGKVPEAIEQYQEALRLQPDDATAHNNLGVVLFRAGRVPEAIEQYEQALRIQPLLVPAHYNFGKALARAGRVQEAVEHLEEAVRLSPNDADSHVELGIALGRQGRLMDAVTQYQQALQIAPRDAAAHSELGAILIVAGKPREAIGHLELALQVSPNATDAQNNLAWLLATLPPAQGGDRARAVNLAQQACQLTGDHSPGNLDTLAVAYAAAGRFEDAVATAQKAIALAQAAGETNLLKEIEARLELYRSGQPYREPLANKR
jgi:protein O-mannosyl-transferase